MGEPRQRRSARFADRVRCGERRFDPDGKRLMADLFQTGTLAIADQAVHQRHFELYGGDRPQPVQPVPVPEPQHDAKRDDRLRLVDRQQLPADRHRKRPGQPPQDSIDPYVQLRRGDRRPEQGDQAVTRFRLLVLQSRQPVLSVGTNVRGVGGLHAGHRAEPTVRRGVLQPGTDPDLPERHPQRMSRHEQGRGTGYPASL